MKTMILVILTAAITNNYVLVKFTSDPAFPAELDRVLGITDGVMRSLITLRAE